ncbi:DUF6786 family protein [Flammeovirga sp. EKP202]|uniref:DUF6786 family protein n=1 Tax=Flammeovirga sp. EKP202 TaxID=2770592 RepID=UPI00165F214A|nr:DUF6786 family protein [Flammeovirga sp. EKP202]MBD0404535.1 hypothetical protein [Flammeovirga sp. EKP202]
MKKNVIEILLVAISFSIFSCQKEHKYAEATFGSDVQFLKKYIDDLIILGEGSHLVAISPKYQGRVFTSTTSGYSGRSIGYFDKKLIASPVGLKKLSKIGGESRMWFGPEVGDFSIFFPPNVERSGENMQISLDLDTLTFNTDKTTFYQSISSNLMVIDNAFGTRFNVKTERKIVFNKKYFIEKKLDIQIPEKVSFVSFSATTTLENLDNHQWKKETGLLPIWEIGCMHPSNNQWAIVPSKSIDLDTVTNYFSPQKDRVFLKSGVAFYKTDAKYLNKMGMPKEDIKPIMGSYSPEFNLLNIVTYSFSNDSLYVSSDWESSKNYKGDVMNIFNGEVNPELDRNYPFFEFESFSAAKELKPNEKLRHVQSIYHFEGGKDDLDLICKKVLGVELSQLPY